MKGIPGFERLYSATVNGQIFSVVGDKAKPLIPCTNRAGYTETVLMDNSGKRKNIKWHRAIATTFIPNPDNKPFINHKNGIKTDNRVENLEWCTPKENHEHAQNVLGVQFGQPKGVRPHWFPVVLLTRDVINIKKRLAEGEQGKKISKEYGVSDQTIYDIKNGRCWTHIKI